VTEAPRRPTGRSGTVIGCTCRRRLSVAAGVVATGVALAALATVPRSPRPLLVWNASASSPIGLYLVRSAGPARVGDTVIAWLPDDARRVAASRRYLPSNVPLVKRVAAVAGDRVCARSAALFVNGRAMAVRRRRDPSGRRLSWWSGCDLLQPGDLFLLSTAPGAFDGRYFGITHPPQVIGRARLIWAA
jgi:conjugative transfer signal peptidase TraF